MPTQVLSRLIRTTSLLLLKYLSVCIILIPCHSTSILIVITLLVTIVCYIAHFVIAIGLVCIRTRLLITQQTALLKLFYKQWIWQFHGLPLVKLNSPIGFFPILKHYLGKKNYFHRRYRKHKLEHYYRKFSYYWKLVKITIKSHRLNCYTSTDNDLKTQPAKFWKYVSSFRRHNSRTIQHNINGAYIVESHKVVETFAEHFQSVYHTSPLNSYHCESLSNDFLQLPAISESDIPKAIKRLKPSKSAGPDDIPIFFIKGCSTIFAPLLTYIFDLRLSQEHFPMQWKSVITVSILKIGNNVLLLAITELFIY